MVAENCLSEAIIILKGDVYLTPKRQHNDSKGDTN